MFSKVLIANRGEIALRIIRTARKLNVSTLVIYSSFDSESPFVQHADKAILIESNKFPTPYLDVSLIIQTAIENQADAIHPGYGFLSESDEFADAVRRSNLIYIGPKTSHIKKMGAKHSARKIMESFNCPVIPGYSGRRQTLSTLINEADRIGLPLILKPSRGGGGAGMQKVFRRTDLIGAIKQAQREAKSKTKINTIVIEKYIPKAKHIEVQVFGDKYGNTVHLFDRDCSFQRKNQKVIEEAPATSISSHLRKTLMDISVSATSSLNYENAGTFEFLVTDKENFYFIELNPRLQVEHTVTETITNIDLVEWQFRVAAGEPLPLTQDKICQKGHSLEARIYAENPRKHFTPTSGKILHLKWPPANNWTRLDIGVVTQSLVMSGFDPMIAKVITVGRNREIALSRLKKAIKGVEFAGPITNLSFLVNLISTDIFKKNTHKTDTIDNHLESKIYKEALPLKSEIVAASIAHFNHLLNKVRALQKTQADTYSPWNDLSFWWLNSEGYFVINYKTQDDVPFEVQINKRSANTKIIINQKRVSANLIKEAKKINVFKFSNKQWIFGKNGIVVLEIIDFSLSDITKSSHLSDCESPISGKVISIEGQTGDFVKKNDTVVIVEAMKMEHSIRAPYSGFITELLCRNGEQVKENQKLFKLSKN